ncbi:4-hydroxybutyrate CoA-transferase, partial [Archaeoglobales archaeon]
VGSTVPPLIKYLSEKENLRVHTGLFHQNLAELVDKGIIKGKCSASVAVPDSKDFYKWLHLNPNVEIRNLNYIYDPIIISKIPKFVAVNSAVAIDLQGQVVSTTIGPRVISGIGGLLDFCRGAKLSKDGKSIIVIESTHKKGSRIRPMIAPGDTVSLTSYDVDYVITEYGVAKVGENSRKKIAEELINVAHPDYRKTLREEARKLNLI